VREIARTAHPGGGTRSERELLVHDDGRRVRDGFEREFSPGGELVSERFYAADVPCGLWREWYPDGTPRAEIDFGEPGKKELLASRYWHANASLAAEGTCRAGLREGEWRFLDEGGQLLRRGEFQDGLRHGAWLFLRPDGSKEAEGRYEHGLRVGTWTLWDELGEAHLRPAADERFSEREP
jgi:antitoxin component YwqK of YwqJK toxin-antitoxin module